MRHELTADPTGRNAGPTDAEALRAYAAKRLKNVFAPEVVGIPPINAIHDLMLLPDLEVRHYGFRGDFRSGNVRDIFLSSPDLGFSWVEKPSPPNCPGATVRSPWSGDYLTLLSCHGKPSLEEFQTIHRSCPEPGMYVHRSTDGPDGKYESRKVGSLLPGILTPRQPIPLRSRKRWIMTAHAAPENYRCQHPVVFLSDDDGVTWRHVILPPIPRFGVAWPHSGPRWEVCGNEPTVVELSDGRLYMLIRTAHDRLWESYSQDGGGSWTDPAPSRFFSTITTPLLFPLSDGRLLVFWNNTTPLPEVDHATQPGLDTAEREGDSEDFFSNRDVIHAAISDDDGKTWAGFREMHLNEARNDADFRSYGGCDSTLDKSVHQSQAVELPEGKVLLAFGQHEACRRMLVFDPDWLLETGRSEDFRLGLTGWSYHQYLKSVPGNFRGFTGHCSLNRRPGATLVPHPHGEMREVFQIARHPDPRLMEEKEGAVWNFPAGHSGCLRMRICQPAGSGGTRISLVDRWFNPTDPVVASFSQLVLDLDPDGRINGVPALLPDQWHWLEISWDLQAEIEGSYRVDEGKPQALALRTPTVNGISYVHLQSSADTPDPNGLLLDRIEKTTLCTPLQQGDSR